MRVERRGNPASVRAHLGDLARRRRVELQVVLSEFAVERFLYRLGVSAHEGSFVLKGATLLRFWSGDHRRATWDLDLLGRGAQGVADVLAAVREVCEVPADDGISFDTASAVGEEIREADAYAGVRVRLRADIAGARIPVQVDVGFGDAVVPPPVREQLSVLLGHEPPCVLVYPRETIVAEKVEAMMSLGVTNSRMKDFYDVHQLAMLAPFEGQTLVRALQATFARRGTALPPGEPQVLQLGFLDAPERRVQWQAFLKRSRVERAPQQETLTEDLRQFLLPPLAAARSGEPFEGLWQPGGPWRTSQEEGRHDGA